MDGNSIITQVAQNTATNNNNNNNNNNDPEIEISSPFRNNTLTPQNSHILIDLFLLLFKRKKLNGKAYLELYFAVLLRITKIISSNNFLKIIVI